MKSSLLFLATLFIVFTSQAQSLSLDWVQTQGGTLYDEGKIVLADHQDNIYVLGRFSNTVDFDPGPGTFHLTSNGSYDVFVQKLTPNGNFLWAKSIGSSSLEWLHGADIDQNNNIVFCGNFNGTMDIDPGPAVDTRTVNGIAGDMYVIKLDSAGDFQWGHTLGDTTADIFLALHIDNNNNIVIGARTTAAVDFDPGPGVNMVTGDAGAVVQYDPNGNLNWVKSFQGNSSNAPYILDLDIDNNNDLVIIGHFSDTVDFDPGPAISLQYPQPNATELFILKLNSLGNYVWAKQINSDNYISTNEVETDLNGNIYIAGDFANNIDCDPNPTITYMLNGPGSAAFVIKLNSTGNFVWAKKMGGASGGLAHDEVTSLRIDNQGDLLLGGYFSGTEDFDPSSNVQFISSSQPADETDCFIMKMTSSGNLVFVKDFGNYASEQVRSMCFDQLGHLYITGYFSNNDPNQTPSTPTDFDPYASVENRLTNGYQDCFLSKFKECTPTSGTANISACNSYTWSNGITYTSNNNSATDTLANINGCDSVVTLNLTLTIVDTTVTVNAGTINSNATNSSYQWIRCENNTPISGANLQSYTPTVSGAYAVVVTTNGCTDTSVCTVVFPVSVSSKTHLNNFTIYPTPASGQVYIKTSDKGLLKVYNHLGQELLKLSIKEKLSGINTKILPSGIYYYLFENEQHSKQTGKFIIK